MEECSPSLDRISNLPSHISQIILMSLPLRDMARTSILSKNWRYQWVKVPQLVFKDDPKYLLSREEKYRYTAMKVFEILLLHHGPISKFSLDMKAWPNCSVIDRIIPFLSRNALKELTLLMPDEKGESYKLPTSILSCVDLRHLSLSSCVFQPLTLERFNELVSLELLNVRLDSEMSISCPFLESLKLDILSNSNVKLSIIHAPNLKKLCFKGQIYPIHISGAPLLKVLSLIASTVFDTGNSSFDLISLLDSLPLLEELCLCYRSLRVLAKGDSSNKFSVLLSNLRMLELISVDARDMNELSSTLWFLRNSTNLQKLKFSRFGNSVTPLVKPTELGPKLILPDCASSSLLKLQKVEIVLDYDWCYLRRDMEFFKFLLDVSPVLKTMYMKAKSNTIDVSGYQNMVELACYGRASPKSEIVFADVNSS